MSKMIPKQNADGSINLHRNAEAGAASTAEVSQADRHRACMLDKQPTQVRALNLVREESNLSNITEIQDLL